MSRSRLPVLGGISLALGLVVSFYVYRNLRSVTGKSGSKPMLHTMVAAKDLSSLIPPGMRAVSVRVNDTSSVSGFVLPGTRVDVLLTGEPQGSSQTQTTTVLENVAVLANGTRLERAPRGGEPISTTVITLLVSPDDAQELTLASNVGRVQLMLRNPIDTGADEVTPFIMDPPMRPPYIPSPPVKHRLLPPKRLGS